MDFRIFAQILHIIINKTRLKLLELSLFKNRGVSLNCLVHFFDKKSD